MYLFSFDKYAWFDRVFKVETNYKLNAWDLIDYLWSIFLVLWEKISFESLYIKFWMELSIKPQVVVKNFLSTKTMEFIHYMVYQNYTSYKNVIELFFDYESADKLLKLEVSKKKIPEYADIQIDYNFSKILLSNKKYDWQQLIVFPDLWTMTNYWIENWKLTIEDWVVLHGHATDKQKNIVFWWIKSWKISTLFCTYSQIFQDWKDLKKIIIIDAHKWYYKSQQDPRYYVPSVLNKFADLYWANIEKFWLQILDWK